MINQETTVKKLTINNLSSGKICRAGYKRGDRDFTDDNQFVSFTIGGHSFFDLKQIKGFLGVSNLRDLEAKATELDLAVYAQWINCDEGHHWSAYLWNGAFRCGSSADRLTLTAA
jgi:hypothetical protein